MENKKFKYNEMFRFIEGKEIFVLRKEKRTMFQYVVFSLMYYKF